MIATQRKSNGEDARPDVVAIDIGNTRTALAAVAGLDVIEPCSVGTGDFEELVKATEAAWARLPSSDRGAIVVASVVPKVLEKLRSVAESKFDRRLLVVRDDIPLPMEVDVENPDTVGVDRVCCAAAAYERLGEACTVVDFGTAVTIDCVSDDGVFLGGAILPGLELASRALNEFTAALPLVAVEQPQDPIGRNTTEAIRSGVLYGLVGAVRELTERYATKLGRWPHLVATGGGAEMVARACQFFDSVVPYLSLRGVALAYRKHRHEQSQS
ncbi:MAG TPA: type III pantothenate kinase [Phycisphaerae bacterium]|nr:type III pantothenate kinase [Phycisphaerae bacterium]